MKLYLSLLALLLSGILQAQTFENIRALRDEDRIIIFYDLMTLDAGSKVDVKLFSSLDNFSSPVTNLTGDVGKISPGPNKRITWLAGEEIAAKLNSIRFELKGDVIIGMSFLNPKPYSKLKPNKNYTLRWQGGTRNEFISIELITPNLETIAIGNAVNIGAFNWKIPRNLKPGDGYSIRLISGQDEIEQRVKVKRKVSLVWYSVPIIAATVGLIYFTDGNSSGDNDLPDAPIPN